MLAHEKYFRKYMLTGMRLTNVVQLVAIYLFITMNSSEIAHPKADQLEPSALSIIHFNDVYDIQPGNSEPKAGAAYFKTLLDRYRM